jgi:alkanesulfonate monooxygenase SsuD/methylene tetrahydromethanopterin reductase-like flavin-dependent oxidoreductase (luciferase family)
LGEGLIVALASYIRRSSMEWFIDINYRQRIRIVNSELARSPGRCIVVAIPSESRRIGMRIGLVVELNGTDSGGERPVERWEGILDQVRSAERIGFDSIVFEDALLLEYGGEPRGLWESVAIAGAIAASTTRIEFGHSVINMPYRSPAMLAKIAITLDEISGGRYIFGIGAGNTPESDYRAFGFPTDFRFSRFAEAIQIIHGLLRAGEVDFSGDFYDASKARTIIRGPRVSGPPILIAGGGAKMLRLVARYADAWNWWTATTVAAVEPTIAALVRACEEEDRDPGSIWRTVDMYSFDPLASWAGATDERPAFGSQPDEMAANILEMGSLGVDEVRCHLHAPGGVDRGDVVAAMADVVDLVHAG